MRIMSECWKKEKTELLVATNFSHHFFFFLNNQNPVAVSNSHVDIMYAVKFTIVLAFLSLIEKDVKLGVLLAAGSNAGFYTRLWG